MTVPTVFPGHAHAQFLRFLAQLIGGKQTVAFNFQLVDMAARLFHPLLQLVDGIGGVIAVDAEPDQGNAENHAEQQGKNKAEHPAARAEGAVFFHARPPLRMEPEGPDSFSAARSFALPARGLRTISSREGSTGFLESRRTSALCPQTQRGR